MTLRSLQGVPAAAAGALSPHRPAAGVDQLIANSLDAMSGPGRLTIHTGLLEPEWVMVEIEDSGCGIEPELWQRIFDLNFTTKREGHFGLGIGLSVSLQIVQQHHGRIEVASEPGRYTRMRGLVCRWMAWGRPAMGANLITTRSMRPESSPASIARRAKPCRQGGAMNKHYLILCVDDEREVLDAVIHDLALFRSHFELEAAESVDEARAVVEEWESDGNKLALILCDHIMPGTLGVDFLVELNRRATRCRQQRRPGSKLEATVFEAVNRGGLHYYLAKPWKLETLQEAVREQLTDYLLAEDGENAFHYAPLLNQARLFAAIHDHPFDE